MKLPYKKVRTDLAVGQPIPKKNVLTLLVFVAESGCVIKFLVICEVELVFRNRKEQLVHCSKKTEVYL
ncbi:hypothetical protein [Wolbachia endosymbiont of Armadillidium arcangelii]|uniref:Uncharacterized protein n=1 Tax=Wolbachia endosymbiont of Armadillidium arcangelii TaxID=3158571 RepID=A0AAU7Q2J4_9RICK